MIHVSSPPAKARRFRGHFFIILQKDMDDLQTIEFFLLRSKMHQYAKSKTIFMTNFYILGALLVIAATLVVLAVKKQG